MSEALQRSLASMGWEFQMRRDVRLLLVVLPVLDDRQEHWFDSDHLGVSVGWSGSKTGKLIAALGHAGWFQVVQWDRRRVLLRWCDFVPTVPVFDLDDGPEDCDPGPGRA